MNGEIANVIMAAANGDPETQQIMKEVFEDEFQTWEGWYDVLFRTSGASVRRLMKRPAGFWERRTFQDLFICCWIHHPFEKGSYMLQLPSANTARDAYEALLASGELESRRSSHLSAAGRTDAAASAHKDWSFLLGYEELLLQIETQAGADYLFLKAEGHPVVGVGRLLHGLSYIKQLTTGAGATANAALKEWARNSPPEVEVRAAENFDLVYKHLLQQLNLTDPTTTVAQVINALCRKANLAPLTPPEMKDTHALGRAMVFGGVNQDGYVERLSRNRLALKSKGIDFTDEVEQTLLSIAQRMLTRLTAHTAQNFHEVRMTPEVLDASLGNFQRIIGAG